MHGRHLRRQSLDCIATKDDGRQFFAGRFLFEPDGLDGSDCYTERLTLGRSGETGRRAGLKIPFPSGSVGSIPTSGTSLAQSASFGRQAGTSLRSRVSSLGVSYGYAGACRRFVILSITRRRRERR